MRQPQETSLSCREWQKRSSGGTGNKSDGRGRSFAPERGPCGVCGKPIASNTWSMWQHYQSVHPDQCQDLVDSGKIPRDWLDHPRSRMRLASVAPPRRGPPVPTSRWAAKGQGQGQVVLVMVEADPWDGKLPSQGCSST